MHRAGMFDQLRGVASTRGEVWADTVAAKLPRSIGKPWPATDRMLAIARRKVADLARDPQLVESLAAELAAWAERRWSARG